MKHRNLAYLGQYNKIKIKTTLNVLTRIELLEFEA